MRLVDFINALGYTNVEDHIKMTLISKQESEFGDEEFVNLKANINTVCKYYNNEICDICADGDGIISLFIKQ